MGGQTGMIIMHSGSTAPTADWLLCDGNPIPADTQYDDLRALVGANTPNMVDKFVRGAGTAPVMTVGGAASKTLTVTEMPSHNHGAATVSGGGGHNHTGTTTSNSRGNMSHTHSGTTATENANHTHDSPAFTTGTVSAWHQHNIMVLEGSGTGDGGNNVDTNPSADGAGRPNVGVTNNIDVAHYHASTAVNTGGVSHNHAHAVTVTNANIDHTHAFTSGAPSVGHTHTISSVGSGTPVDLVPAFFALTFIIHK